MQTIVITGASDGIGAELARQLAKQLGSDVRLVLAARQEALLEQVAAACQALGASVRVIRTDVSDPQQCRQLIDTTVAECGGMDVLINNAGVSAHAMLSEVHADDLAWYESLMRVNLWGSVWCTHAASASPPPTQASLTHKFASTASTPKVKRQALVASKKTAPCQ